MKFFLEGRIDGLNAVIDANRANRYAGASLKKETTEALAWRIKALNLPHIDNKPHSYTFTWHEPNRRRDPDNIASAAKFVLDALQEAGVIDNDGWHQVAEIHHRFVKGDEVGVEVKIDAA